jgi:hypothetical protein
MLRARRAREHPEGRPHDFWGGWSGQLQDPDGHLWEIAHNPFFPLDAVGNVTLAG